MTKCKRTASISNWTSLCVCEKSLNNAYDLPVHWYRPYIVEACSWSVDGWMAGSNPAILTQGHQPVPGQSVADVDGAGVASGWCPTHVLSDSNPVSEQASPWRRCPRRSGTAWRLWRYEVGHYPASIRIVDQLLLRRDELWARESHPGTLQQSVFHPEAREGRCVHPVRFLPTP